MSANPTAGLASVPRQFLLAYVAVAYVVTPVAAVWLAAGPWSGSGPLGSLGNLLLGGVVVHHAVVLVVIVATSDSEG